MQRDEPLSTAHPEAGNASGAEHRLFPRAGSNNFLVLRALARQLRYEIDANLHARTSVAVLDVGCGEKPYRSLFRGIAKTYVGVDLAPGPFVDQVVAADSLPFEDGSFDCVICTQMLEHVPDPDAVVREAFRVMRVDGLALFSTHGTFRYHPNPEDYWRWTHAGLGQLFQRNGAWASIRVHANGGTATGLAYLFTSELHGLCAKARVPALARPVVTTTNLVAANIDRALRGWYTDHPPAIVGNYLVAAVK